MDHWWLRSLGYYSYYASYVGNDGSVNRYGSNVDLDSKAARPALHLNLSSASWSPADPVSSDGGEMVSTWDCVWFGNYPQSDAAGVTKDSIKWRVLSVDGDDAFLLADRNLDVQKYNNTDEDVTWKTCTIRTWLNSTFLNKGFNASEQAAIRNAAVVNENNQYMDTEGGENTVDKVYLLSLSEAMNSSYGFISTMDSTATREAVNTAYVAAGGETGYKLMEPAGRTDHWWLRSPGVYCNYASTVSNYGIVYPRGSHVSGNHYAVRPALYLNLSSTSEWSYAGTVSSNGEENEIPAPNSPVIASPTPSLIPGGESSAPPSVSDKPSSSSNPSTGQSTTTVILPTSVPRVSEETSQPQISTKVQTSAKVTSLKLKAEKKAIQASWKKASDVAGYEIQVSTSKKFAKKSVKTTKKTKLTISKLKPKTKYFVRVRAYRVANGKKTYGKWSNIMNIKTKK